MVSRRVFWKGSDVVLHWVRLRFYTERVFKNLSAAVCDELGSVHRSGCLLSSSIQPTVSSSVLFLSVVALFSMGCFFCSVFSVSIYK